MPSRAPRLHLLVLPLVALLAVIPLVINGPSCGHDFDFHLLNWLEAARQISAGNLHPHWAQTPAWNAGEPRFVFYPPLSWALGGLLNLALTHLPGLSPSSGFTLAPILFTWLALSAAGLSLYSLARTYVPQSAALMASAFYIVNPYTLFTAYERTAYGELLAAAWIPLLLRAVLPPPAPPNPAAEGRAPRLSIPRLALPLALLWLTNAPAAVMASYTVLLVLALRLLQLWRSSRNLIACINLAARAAAGTALGLSLAAFYIVPAAYEQRWVQVTMAVIPGMRIVDNFLFGHAPASMPDAAAHDAVLHTASLVALLLLTLTALLLSALAFRRRSRPASTLSPPILYLAAVGASIAVLLLPISLGIWRHVPELAFLQFPWRLLAILAPVCALALGLNLSELRMHPSVPIVSSLALAVLCLWPAYRSFRQGCDAEDTPAARLAAFRTMQGTEPTDEYTPTLADNDALHPGNLPFRTAPADDPSSSSPAAIGSSDPAPGSLDVDAPTRETLIFNLRDYPAWQVHLNGRLVTERHERDDGLLAIPLPAGHDHITITYGNTIDGEAGDAISAAALLVFVTLAWRRPQPRHPALTR